MVIPDLFYIELCMEPIGVGLDLDLLKENERWPHICILFLKGIMMVHETKKKSWEFQHEIF